MSTIKKQSSRFPALLDVAASLFAAKGYHPTTMRDIAAMTDLTPGAIYFHIPTKEKLLLAVYEEGARRSSEHIRKALIGVSDPWERLGQAMTAHLEVLLDGNSYSRAIVRVLPGDVPEVASDLLKIRDGYEDKFRRLINDLNECSALMVRLPEYGCRHR